MNPPAYYQAPLSILTFSRFLSFGDNDARFGSKQMWVQHTTKKKKKTERKGGTEVMDLERGDKNFKAHMLQQIRCTLVHRREFSNWAS